MSINENNKLIAEFLKLPIHKSIDTNQYLTKWNGRNFWQSIEFHESWNWIMEAVEQIMLVDDGEYYIEITYHSTVITACTDLSFHIYSDTDDKMITHVYNAVVEFVKQYKSVS